MSFSDISVDGPTMGGSSRATARVEPSPSAGSSAVASITANIARLNDYTMKMSRMVKKFGSEHDTVEFRAEMRDMRRQSTNLSKQTGQLLSTTGYQNADWRIQQARLKKDFEGALEGYYKVNIVVKDKEAEYVARAKEAERGRRALHEHDETHINIPGGGDPEQESLLQSDEQRQQAIRMDDMIQYNENLIAERSKDVQSIERDVMEINAIFKDLAVMVNDQGAKIDQIENHIQSTVDDTEAASEEIDKAYDSHKKAR